jgi:protein TonB
MPCPPRPAAPAKPRTTRRGRSRPPIVWMALAQAALAALVVHLVSAGGVQSAPPPLPPPPAPVVTPAPEPAPPPVEPTPAVKVVARPIVRRPDPSPTPVPTPLPLRAQALPDVLPGPPSRPAAPTVDTSRVYDEDEVDVKPRRIVGASAPYPEWGPKLSRGERVSITASFVVNEEGDVTDIRVEHGGGVLEAVLLELSRWKYEPGRKDGRPVKVRLSWRHTFIGG